MALVMGHGLILVGSVLVALIGLWCIVGMYWCPGVLLVPCALSYCFGACSNAVFCISLMSTYGELCPFKVEVWSGVKYWEGTTFWRWSLSNVVKR